MFRNIIDKTIFDSSDDKVYYLLLQAIASNQLEQKTVYIITQNMESTFEQLLEALERNNNFEVLKICNSSLYSDDKFNISLKGKNNTTTEIRLEPIDLLTRSAVCGERCEYFIVDVEYRFTKSLDTELINTVVPSMMCHTSTIFPFGGTTLLYNGSYKTEGGR